MTQPEAASLYEFGGFRLDPQRRLLSGPDAALIALKPKVFDTLLYFVEHSGHVLDKRELMKAIWGDVIVEENSLNQHISTLRRVLGESPGENRFIVTLPGRGYRFVAPLRTRTGASELPDELGGKHEPFGLDARQHAGRWGRSATRTIASIFALLSLAVVGWYVSQTTRPPVRTLAVLPFTDLSEGRDRAWYADGLAEEILNSLNQLPELRVTASTSSFQFRGENRDIGEIAAALRVSYVIEGSVRWSGDRARVTVKLVRARDGYQVWSEAYESTTNELFEFQHHVAEKIASALDVVLDENRRAAMFRSGTRNVDAFEAYQRGWAIYLAVHNGQTDHTLWDANAYFERALALDPRYASAALAHVDAFSHQLTGDEFAANSAYTEEEALGLLAKDLSLVIENSPRPSVRLAAELALVLFSPTWHRIPGLIDELSEEWDGSLTSEDAFAAGLWNVLLFTGHDDLVRQMADKQLEIDRLAPAAWIARTDVELHSGNFDLARAIVAEARRTVGDRSEFKRVDLRAAFFQGKRDEVIQLLGTPAGNTPFAALVTAVSGDYETARRMADELDRQAKRPQWDLLTAYYEMGATDRVRDLAKRFDQLPVGPALLLGRLANLPNTLRFNLEDTPLFLVKLRQAGIDPATFTPAPRISTSGE